MRAHHGVVVTLSNAVEPSMTASTATSPGAAGRPSRPSNGLRRTSLPSSRRPRTDSRPMKVEKTSKPSPRANHAEPKNNAAIRWSTV
jgi:cell division septation protein DedD